MAALMRFRTPILVGVGALVVSLVVLLAWIVPEGHKVSSLDVTKQTLTTQEEALQAEIVALQHDADQKVTNCSTLTALLDEVPPTLDESQFVLDVGKLAQTAGAPSIPSLTWGASTPGSGVDAVAVGLTLQGSFGQVMAFVKGLDGSDFQRLFTVSSFTVAQAGSTGGGGGGGGGAAEPVIVGTSLQSSSAPSYSVTLEGSIYYAPAQSDACLGLKGVA